MDSRLAELEIEVHRLRQSYGKLRWLFIGSLTAVVAIAVAAWSFPPEVRASGGVLTSEKDGVIHLRGLVIEDAAGHERLRLGAPLPDPLIHGVRQHRKGPISGMIINDANGNERGSFVTDDQYAEAFMSLDAAGDQQVLFLANPEGGVNFDLYDKAGNEAAITVFPKGPRLVLKKQKQIVVDLPEVK